MAYYPEEFAALDLRRRELGLSCRMLAQKTKLSLRTVQRICSGEHPDASWSNVRKLAEAMGLKLMVQSGVSAQTLREQQARLKAERIVRMVQGTSALEAQPLEKDRWEDMIRQTMHELMAGPNRDLWAD